MREEALLSAGMALLLLLLLLFAVVWAVVVAVLLLLLPSPCFCSVPSVNWRLVFAACSYLPSLVVIIVVVFVIVLFVQLLQRAPR